MTPPDDPMIASGSGQKGGFVGPLSPNGNDVENGASCAFAMRTAARRKNRKRPGFLRFGQIMIAS
jgi:hypothetical protein